MFGADSFDASASFSASAVKRKSELARLRPATQKRSKNENESFRRGSFFVFDKGDLIGVGVSIIKRSTGRICDSFSAHQFYPHDPEK